MTVDPGSLDEGDAKAQRINRDRWLTVGTLTVDRDTGLANRAGRALKLWPKEFALLAYLMERANEVVTPSDIATQVWGDAMAMWTNVIAVNVNGLRREIERDGMPTMLHTIRGKGYMIAERPPESEGDA